MTEHSKGMEIGDGDISNQGEHGEVDAATNGAIIKGPGDIIGASLYAMVRHDRAAYRLAELSVGGVTPRPTIRPAEQI